MHKHILIDGVLTSYLELNSHAKETCILLHGWGHDASLWVETVSRLPQNFRYILFDLPGFGGTGLLSGTPNVKEYADFIKSALKKLQIDNAWFLGHSFGGQIACYLAVNSPNLLQKMILISPAVIRTKSSRDKVKIFLFKKFTLFKKILPRKIVEWLLKKVTAVDYFGSSPVHREILKKIVNFEQKDELAKITTPTLLLWGEKDSAIHYEGKQIASSIQNCRLKVLYGVGHNPHLYSPQLLADEIHRYMRL